MLQSSVQHGRGLESWTPRTILAAMIPLFLGLTIANLATLLAVIGLGYLGSTGNGTLHGWHMVAGAMAAMLCVAVHCIVFTYFVATAKWVRHAVTVKGLDAAYIAPTRSFKAQAFPAALGAMFAVFLAAVLGAAVDTRVLAPPWHQVTALLAVFVNLLAAAIEYNAISRNGRLIDQVLSEMPLEEADSRIV